MAELRTRGVPRLLVVTDGTAPDAPRLSRGLGVVAARPTPSVKPGAGPSAGGRRRTASHRCSTTTACCITATTGSRCRRSSSRSPPRCSTGSARSSPATRSPVRAWPEGLPTRNALDVHVLRLRRRIAPLGSRSAPCGRAATVAGGARTATGTVAPLTPHRLKSAVRIARRAGRGRHRRDVHRRRRRRRARSSRCCRRRTTRRAPSREAVARARRRRPRRTCSPTARRSRPTRCSSGAAPRVALVTTAGFADVIEIARQDRPSLYDPFADRPEPLVPRALRFEVDGRLDADGAELDAAGRRACRRSPDDVDAVAVCLLHADLNPRPERDGRRRAARARASTSRARTRSRRSSASTSARSRRSSTRTCGPRAAPTSRARRSPTRCW